MIPLVKRDNFNVSGVSYTLTYAARTDQPVEVFFDGVLQPTSNYSVSGATLTIDAGVTLAMFLVFSVRYYPVGSSIASTSAETDYLVRRQDIIKDAMYLCNALSFADEVPPENQEMAVQAFNVYIKALMAKAPHLWRQTEGILFLEQGTAQYALGSDHACPASAFTETELTAAASSGGFTLTVDSISGIFEDDIIGIELEDGTMQWTTVSADPSGSSIVITDALTGDAEDGATIYSYNTLMPRPLRVTDAWRRVNGIDTPVPMVSRQEYFEQPNKTSQGKICLAYYSPELNLGQMYVWPTPNDATDQLRFTYERTLEDMDNNEDVLDFPVEWTEAVTYGLAVRLAPRLGVAGEKLSILKSEAEQKQRELLDFDQEYASIKFEPSYNR